jgi:hypothetical protein
LLDIKTQGRERYCEAKMGGLCEVSDWVGQYKEFWNKKLDALEIYLNELQQKNKPQTTKRKK